MLDGTRRVDSASNRKRAVRSLRATADATRGARGSGSGRAALRRKQYCPLSRSSEFSVGTTGLSASPDLGSAPRPSAASTARSRDEDAIALIDHAWEMGIRYFDAAPLYGYGNGERRMGAAASRGAARRVRVLHQGRPAGRPS